MAVVKIGITQMDELVNPNEIAARWKEADRLLPETRRSPHRVMTYDSGRGVMVWAYLFDDDASALRDQLRPIFPGEG